MIELRERGIYLAPDGQRFIASQLRRTTADGRRILSRLGGNVSCFLFGAYQWAFHGEPDFEVAPGGKLIAIKRPPDWQIDDLIDSNTTAGVH